MFIFIIVYFFFRLPERKSYQKERAPAVPGGLLRPAFSLKGKNSLRSNSLPFFTTENWPPLNARRSMPENHAALDADYGFSGADFMPHGPRLSGGA